MAGILTDNQVQQYRNQGYLLVERLFDEIQMKLARQAIQEMLCELDGTSDAEVEPDNPTVSRRIWSPTERHRVFQEMAYNSKILDRVESLIGPNIAFHYSKLTMKPAHVGSVVEWHQDLAYYPHTNTDVLTCLIYLDDATQENGCLQVIPGSHQYGILDHSIDGYFRGKLNAPSTVLDLTKVTSCTAPAGSTIFLHGLTAHSSIRNQSNMPRRAFISSYRAADAYPIYLGPHATNNESSTKLLRGQRSNAARTETGIWQLPIAQSSFNSLYEIQEGSHLNLN